MMKKITTLMVMLMGCVSSALAQMVASTSTPLESLQSGYYVLLMKTADDKTDKTNGNFVYYEPEDLGVHYDEASATDHNLRSATLNSSDFKYVFYVEKTGDKISLKAYGTNYYWPAIPAPEKDRNKNDPANQQSFTVGTLAANYDYIQDGEWYKLQMPAQKYVPNLFYTRWTLEDVTALVNVNNDPHKIGYWESAGDNQCRFQFYAVNDMLDPSQVATITYNYTFGGQVRKTRRFYYVRKGGAYPDVDVTGLYDYVTAENPAGTVSEDETIDIPLKEDLPFQTSTDSNPIYYYLENVQGDGTRLYANGSSLAYRTAEQAANVNDVRNDLWYVTGNVYDGFEFHSAGGNKTLKSSAIMSHSSLCALSFSYVDFGEISKCATNWELYKIISGNKSVFGVLPHNSTTGAGSKDYSWKWNGEDINFNSPNGEDETCAFRLVPATFTFPMYAVDGSTYNTFAAPFDVALAEGESEVKMYKGAMNAAEKELVLSEVSAAPAGAGVMLMGEGSQAESVTLKVVSGAVALEGNDLVGTTSNVSAGELADKLILGVSDETGAVGFFSASTSVVSLRANHAYLNKATVSGVKGVTMRIDGEATAIGRIDADANNQANGALYDLTGRRVSRTEKGGLYIQNGRKFIAK